MKRKSAIIVALLLSAGLVGAASFPSIIFQQAFGGTNWEGIQCMAESSDGGYLLGLSSTSLPSGNKTSTNFGGSIGAGDYWIVKVDSSGNKEWEQNFGDWGDDDLRAVAPTADGGFLLGGSSRSTILWGNKTATNQCGLPFCGSDFWLVKVGSNGVCQWQQTYGSSTNAEPNFAAIVPSIDGGYFLAGTSDSSNTEGLSSSTGGNKTAIGRGGSDYWVVKIGPDGTKQWDQTYGGTRDDIAESMVQTADGGFLLGGLSLSPSDGTKTAPLYGSPQYRDSDYWVVRADANGNQLWDRSFGGGGSYQLRAIVQTPDSGFLLGGYSASRTNLNFWVVRIDADGNKLWDQSYGGKYGTRFSGMTLTPDGGGLLAGTIWVSDHNPDIWLIKIDEHGNPQWDCTFGGSDQEGGGILMPTSDGNYLLGGYCSGAAGGTRTVAALGVASGWLLKISGGPKPVVVSQPQSTVFVLGQNLRLEVQARSFYEPLYYQWRFNGSGIPGATSATLLLTNAQPAFAGTYTCFITNRLASTETDPAVLSYSPAASLSMTINPVLTILGTTGRTYSIEYTIDPYLQDGWTTITNFTLTTNPLIWTDPTPVGGSNRFYRALLAP